MPAIKKKWIKANQEVSEADSNDNNNGLAGDEDREQIDEASSVKVKGEGALPLKSKKRSIDPSMLRGLDGEVLQEKRKRFIPPAEAKLSEWLDSNLEKRNDVTLSLVQLYKYYTELCQGQGSDILDIPAFNRMIKNKFGKTFGIKESSVYKSILKERNLNQKKAGEGVKLKEIAHEAINHFGNPWNGVRFFSLKQYVGTKYPLLKIDQRPKILKRILEMGVGYGQIEVVKGIGMAGFYRLPGAEPPKPKVKHDKVAAQKESKTEDAEDSVESESAEQENKEGHSNEKEKETETGAGDIDKKDKPKDHKPKKQEKCNLKRVPHGNPKKIEDTFPLAITFQSAPKTASLVKIRRYIQDHYNEIVGDGRWRKAVEGGAEKGYWEYLSGSGITGKLHLLMDDFDPDSENLYDMICAAIIACHEPKAASGNQIKKYISRYHPDFNVDTKPDRFKKALIRAAERKMIVQVSGLGANGSFELHDIFVPSPRVLSGENASSDEEEGSDSYDDEPVYIPKGTKSRGPPPKKSVKKQEVVRKLSASLKKSALAKKQSKKELDGKGGGRLVKGKFSPKKNAKDESPLKTKSPTKSKKHVQEDSEEEDMGSEDEPEYTPRKSMSRGGATKTVSSNKKNTMPKKLVVSDKQAQKQKRSATPLDDSSAAAKRTSLNIQSRGKAASASQLSKDSKMSPKKSDKKPSRASSASSKKRQVLRTPTKSGGSITTLKFGLQGDSDGDDADSEPEYSPKKSSSRGGSASVSPRKNKR